MEYPLKDGKGTKGHSFKEFNLTNGTKIGVFQGNRGENPELDILIKYQEPGKRVRTPKHIHWVIDILIKKEHNKELTLEFLKFLREMWNRVEAFNNKSEQQKCKLKYVSHEKLNKFKELNNLGEYSLEFIVYLIELMIIMEKTGKSTAYVFKNMLDALLKNDEIFVIVSKATQNGKL